MKNPRTRRDEYADRIHGLLLGCALGDSIGLPLEGRPRSWIARNRQRSLQQRLVFGKGMLSDDTEHSLLLAQALHQHPDCAVAFGRRIGIGLRWWLLGLPAGIGFATIRSIVKLWLGFTPTNSGVSSAGNGAAMRCAIIGAYFSKEPKKIPTFVRAATRITHTDEKAYVGALAVARIAAWHVNHQRDKRPNINELRALLESSGKDSEWGLICQTIEKMAQKKAPVDHLASELKIKPAITGYVYHTVPIAIYASWRHAGCFREGIEAAVRCGGDTDTVAAICGSLLGSGCGAKGLPNEWAEDLVDWPRNKNYIRNIANSLADQTPSEHQIRSLRLNPVAILGRNIIFLIIVVGHGLRRLLPPY